MNVKRKLKELLSKIFPKFIKHALEQVHIWISNSQKCKSPLTCSWWENCLSFCKVTIMYVELLINSVLLVWLRVPMSWKPPHTAKALGYSRSVWKCPRVIGRLHTKDRRGFSNNSKAIKRQTGQHKYEYSYSEADFKTYFYCSLYFYKSEANRCEAGFYCPKKYGNVYLTYDFSNISNLNWLLVWIKSWCKIYICCRPEMHRRARDVSYCSHFCCCAIISPCTNVPGSISPLNNPDF